MPRQCASKNLHRKWTTAAPRTCGCRCEKPSTRYCRSEATSQNFEQLYRCAYAMVLRNEGERLYKGLREAIKEHLVKKVRPLVLAEVGDDCLRTINQAWEDYQTSMGMIGDIVIYLDHAYVPKNDVDSVRNLGVLLFLDEVVHYDVVRDHLRDAMLGLGLGLRSVYEEDFEKPFLDESAQFYALRGQRYIGTKDCLEYIAQVEQHINEESERAKQCLDKSTVVAVLHVVEKELIWKHMKAIVDMDSGVEYMLKKPDDGRPGPIILVPQTRSRWRPRRCSIASASTCAVQGNLS
ncbi:hypothetical protein MRX96_055853 [Rhipicephalus microplus]